MLVLCWSFILGSGFNKDPWTWAIALLLGAQFFAFGLCFGALLGLTPNLYRPAWLTPRQAALFAVVFLAVQSLLAGVLTFLGVWPHPSYWYLGVLPFFWG
jgi:hypothetical protein